MNGISVYDIIILAVLALLTIRGGIRGAAMQLASLASLILSWIVAVQFSRLLAPKIGLEEPWNRVVAMLVLFVGTYLAVWIAFRFVSGMISAVKLKEFDRQMGALIGFTKGVIVCMIITFFAVSMDWSRAAVYESKSGYYLTQAVEKAKAVIPEDIATHIKEKLKKYHLDADDFPEEEDRPVEQGGAGINLFGIQTTPEQIQGAAKVGSLIGEVKDFLSGNGQTQGEGSTANTASRSTTSTFSSSSSTPANGQNTLASGRTEQQPLISEQNSTWSPSTANTDQGRGVSPYRSPEEPTETTATRPRSPWNSKLWSKAFQEGEE